MKRNPQNRRGSEPKPQAAVHQLTQRTDQRTLQTNHTAEAGIRLGAACFVGVAIASWAFGVSLVVGGAA